MYLSTTGTIDTRDFQSFIDLILLSAPRYKISVTLVVTAFFSTATILATILKDLVENITTYPYKLCEVRDRKGDLKKRWYVEFYVWDIHTSQLVRKVDYSINRFKTAKERYKAAEQLVREINKALAQGFVHDSSTPDEREKKREASINGSIGIVKAIDFALKIKSTENSKKTSQDYKSVQKHLVEWLKENKYDKYPLNKITPQIIMSFFDYLKLTKKIANVTYNNYRIYVRAIFNFYIKREVLVKNPASVIQKLKEQEKTHVPYLPAEIEEIKKLLQDSNPQLWIFCQCIYYTFIRPKELRLIQIKNIKDDKILIPAKIKIKVGKQVVEERVSKNGKNEFVVMPKGLKDVIQSLDLDKYPSDYFIFGKQGKPSPTPVSVNYFTNQFKNEVKDELKFINGHTLYSWKHTGVINLYNAIKDIKKIQQQCRHYDITVTAKYLRELGLFDNKEVEELFPTI